MTQSSPAHAIGIGAKRGVNGEGARVTNLALDSGRCMPLRVFRACVQRSFVSDPMQPERFIKEAEKTRITDSTHDVG